MRWVRYVFLMMIWLLVIECGMLVNVALRPRASNSSDEPAWRATRDLPALHQLRTGDLDGGEAPEADLKDSDSLIGQHLRTDVKKGTVVKSEHVSVLPSLFAQKGRVVYLYSLSSSERPLAGLVEPGSPVRLCSGEESTCFDGPLTVLAAHRATNTSPGDWLALLVADDDFADFHRLATSPQRVLALGQ